MERSASTSWEPTAIGTPPWTRAQMIEALPAFAAVYARRPIRDNRGGMGAPHLFLAWFALRALRPEVVVESGVLRGLGTWLIEQAAPSARIECIEPRPRAIAYRSPRARYHREDFSRLDWRELPRERTVLFFDDHQDALARVRLCARLGLRHLLCEDNYPPGRGDCYSLKQAFAGAGFTPPPPAGSLLRRVARRLLGRGATGVPVPPGGRDARDLRELLEVYEELPPPFRVSDTRFGDAWEGARYATPAPLLDAAHDPFQRVLLDEARSYTWLCYARLRAANTPGRR
jgi:hypothetical protein